MWEYNLNREENMLFRDCKNAPMEVRNEKPNEPYVDGMKHCGFCGSLDPVELAEAIANGKATMHGTDWKYGYPHKFYVDVPNLVAGQIVRLGGTSRTNEKGERVDEPFMEPAPETCRCKFYVNHLALLDDETFEKVAPIINAECGVTFYKVDGKLRYDAPEYNYQKD